MNIATAMMVVADRCWAVSVPVYARVAIFVRRDMDVSLVMVALRLRQGDGRPVGGVAERVLRLHHAMQVHGRQEGDT